MNKLLYTLFICPTAAILLAAAVGGVFSSCTPRVLRTEEVIIHDTIHTHAVDTVRLVSNQRDSIFLRDSIFFAPTSATVPAGQMLIKERHHHHFHTRRDTVRMVHTDTIYKSADRQHHTETTPTPKPTTWPYFVLMGAFAVAGVMAGKRVAYFKR